MYQSGKCSKCKIQLLLPKTTLPFRQTWHTKSGHARLSALGTAPFCRCGAPQSEKTNPNVGSCFPAPAVSQDPNPHGNLPQPLRLKGRTDTIGLIKLRLDRSGPPSRVSSPRSNRFRRQLMTQSNLLGEALPQVFDFLGSKYGACAQELLGSSCISAASTILFKRNLVVYYLAYGSVLKTFFYIFY